MESVRVCDGETSCEARYYISSLAPDPQRLGEAIRTHWSVENPLHWVLDIAFREDECRIRNGHAPENFTLLRHLAVSALNQEKTAKILSIRQKSLKASQQLCFLSQLSAFEQVLKLRIAPP